VATPAPPVARGDPPAVLTAEEARWLHDKFERLAAEEVQLSASRTAYFAAIGTILITGAIVATADLLNESFLLAGVVTFIAALGLLVSFVWVVLLHRTNDAQTMWREAALRLEELRAPISGVLRAPITLRSGRALDLDLLRPYLAHRERFNLANHISWLDRVNPERLTESLPITFFVVWSATLVLVWSWFVLLR
jgi:hypothetical protein